MSDPFEDMDPYSEGGEGVIDFEADFNEHGPCLCATCDRELEYNPHGDDQCRRCFEKANGGGF